MRGNGFFCEVSSCFTYTYLFEDAFVASRGSDDVPILGFFVWDQGKSGVDGVGPTVWRAQISSNSCTQVNRWPGIKLFFCRSRELEVIYEVYSAARVAASSTPAQDR